MLAGHLDADIVCNFKGHHRICQPRDLSMQTTGGHYLVSFFKVTQVLLVLLGFFLLGPDQQEIDNYKYQNEWYE